METTKHVYCVPGDRLCISDDHNISGEGTYVSRNYIYASLCGIVKIEQRQASAAASTDSDSLITQQQQQKQQRTICVVHSQRSSYGKMPTIGSIATCRVLSISSNQAKCQISCVDDKLLRLPFKAILRKEDVRAEDKDRVEMHNAYRPKDIILARVFGISDKGYLLTTAEDELGVVIAYSETNSPMIPISWDEVICSDTYTKQKRKLAKIFDQEAASESLKRKM